MEENLEETGTEQKTFTQEEMEKLLQKEGDRRVTSAQSKWEKEADKRVSQAEKLAKMDEDSKAQFQMEEREKALEQREKDLTLNANRVECSRILTEKGLPAELTDFVVSDDAEIMNDNIKLFERVIKDTVSKEVLERIGSDSPQTGGNSGGTVTKESFRKMNLGEQMEIYNRDPELYNRLTK